MAPPLDASTQVLLNDGSANAIVAVRTYPDGRENLAITVDSSPYLLHGIALSYGVVRWVTRGLFLGERRAFVGAQIDDLFLDNDMYDGGTFRITGKDLGSVLTWQLMTQSQANTQSFTYNLAFNGYGTTRGAYPGDTLTSAA
jgi:hypothetical protein